MSKVKMDCRHSLFPACTLRKPWSLRPCFDPLPIMTSQSEKSFSAFRRFRVLGSIRQTDKKMGQTDERKVSAKLGESEGGLLISFFLLMFILWKISNTQKFPEYCTIPPVFLSPSFNSYQPKAISFHLYAYLPSLPSNCIILNPSIV